VLTKEAHRFKAGYRIPWGNGVYDALPSSAHPITLAPVSILRKRLFGLRFEISRRSEFEPGVQEFLKSMILGAKSGF